MKKIVTLLSLFAAVAVNAQSVTMYNYQLSSGTVGAQINGGDTIVLNETSHYEHDIKIDIAGVATGDAKVRVQVLETTTCFTHQICGTLIPDPDFQSSCWDLNSTDYMTPTMYNINPSNQLFAITPKGSITCGGTAHLRYTVYVNNTVMDSVDIIINSTLSAPSISKEAVDVTVYPNPVANYLNINASGIDENIRVQITDVLGKEVYDETVASTKKIDVSDFKNGVYIVAVSENGKPIKTKRIVVKH